MNALAEPFKQLVERRLWPVALLLLAGVIAVPMLLAKDPEPVSGGPVALSAVPAGQGSTEPVVSLSDPASRDEVRAVLGDRKDPFRPAQIERVPAPDEAVATSSTAASASVDSGASSAGDVSSGGGGGTPSAGPPADPAPPAPAPVDPDPTTAPTPDPRPEPQPAHEVYSLKVRFGDPSSGSLETRNVKRLTGLPGGNPTVLYLGPTDGGSSAVFLVDAGVEVVGDGACRPHPQNCETLEMNPGETVFLTTEDAQYQLDLIRINTRTTRDAGKARRLRTAVASGGPAALRRMGGSRGYRYDAASGVLVRTRSSSRALKSSFDSAG